MRAITKTQVGPILSRVSRINRLSPSLGEKFTTRSQDHAFRPVDLNPGIPGCTALSFRLHRAQLFFTSPYLMFTVIAAVIVITAAVQAGRFDGRRNCGLLDILCSFAQTPRRYRSGVAAEVYMFVDSVGLANFA
jgi:hypothetical protein